MKNTKIQNWMGALLVICGLMLIAVLYVPMWYIDLAAPQYPEGLRLLIFADKIGGNVDIINGLNHYIGMKTLHTEDFIEFKILPYVIVFFVVAFILVGLLRNRKLMNLLLILFISFGVIAMVDFWRWEYNYGHNLDPTAAIIVPGMAYQPPLIGFKQLLNFGAYSMPDTGGWLFVTAGVVLLFNVITDRIRNKKQKSVQSFVVAASAIMAFMFFGCSTEPSAIIVGKDNCQYCKMTISDKRFGAEIVTKKGKVFKYDEAQCLLSDIKEKGINADDIKDIYLTDFCAKHGLIEVKKSLLLKSEEFKSPMGGNVAAFSISDSLKVYKEALQAEDENWANLEK